MKGPIVGVLALQGCVFPHRYHIESLGGIFKEVRTTEDFKDIQALILPGGESTTMLKLIKLFSLEESLRAAFERVPTWGICAGAILLAKTVESPHQWSFGALDISIQRNGYGRQLDSFNTEIEGSPVSFIRAPIIKSVGLDVQVKVTDRDFPVWVQSGHIMATTFHPELPQEKPSHMHDFFLKNISSRIYK